MKTVALYNIKGGVGKTAAAVNLAWLAAKAGNRVLVWDLDPQAATSFYFRIKPKIKGGEKALVTGTREIDDVIKGTDFDHLDLLPSDFSYRKLDSRLEKEGKINRVAKLLKPLADDYDYVFLDCPPSISQLSENIFRAADVLMVPLLPTTLSLRTYDQLTDFCKDRKIGKLKILPFFSMVDRRKSLHKQIMQSFPKKNKSCLKSNIPYSSAVEQMGLERAPVGVYAPRTASAIAYRDLWKELKKAL